MYTRETQHRNLKHTFQSDACANISVLVDFFFLIYSRGYHLNRIAERCSFFIILFLFDRLNKDKNDQKEGKEEERTNKPVKSAREKKGKKIRRNSNCRSISFIVFFPMSYLR